VKDILNRNACELPVLTPIRAGEGGVMKHYRLNKVAEPDGPVLKKKDILAADDREALNRAAEDNDCPICDVYRSGAKVGSIT
jgi:hypothetical protein